MVQVNVRFAMVTGINIDNIERIKMIDVKKYIMDF